MQLVYLCFFAFVAGFIDSVAGGGGLIQLPALLIGLPTLPNAAILGTNKFSSIFGTTAAAVAYRRKVRIDPRVVVPAAIAAGCMSFVGARVATLISSTVFRPLVLVLLIAVALYTLWQKNLGAQPVPRVGGRRQTMAVLALGTTVGFYDGFLGPGTGSFLIFGFITILGFDFLMASATAKTVNVAANLAALAYFVLTGHVLYGIALPMAMCNILGGVVGARLALRRGSAFVRLLFLVVVSAVIARFAYDLLA